MTRGLVWVLSEKRLVMVSEDLSPYTEGYYVGVFHTGRTFGWGKAGEVAEVKAKELGFTVEYHPLHEE